MKELKWNKVISLCRIQIAEFLTLFSKWMVLFSLFILAWPLLTNGGDVLSSCQTMARWILMLPIVLVPPLNCTFFIGENNKLMLPASPIEKYTSIWLSSLILTGMEIILSVVLVLSLLYGLNAVFFQEDFKDIGLTMTQTLSLNKVLFSVTGSIGCVLLVFSAFIPRSWRHRVYGVFVLSLLLYPGVQFALPETVRELSHSLLPVLLSISLWIWGYRIFKQIQPDKKK